MAIAEAPQPGIHTSSVDVWKSSDRFTPNLSGPFAWRRRLGVISSGGNSIKLKNGRQFEIDGSGRINGIPVRGIQKEDLE